MLSVADMLGRGCTVLAPGRSFERDVLLDEIDRWRALVTARAARVVGLLADNSPEWIAADLGIRAAGAVCVALPSFFADTQLEHVIAHAGIDHVLTDTPQRLTGLDSGLRHVGSDRGFTVLAREVAAAPALHPDTVQMTFTSGSTGQPKGVCLGAANATRLAESLAGTLAALGIRRHLSVLPYATLLENVAGSYAALGIGAAVCAPPLAEVGFTADGGFEPQRFLACLHYWAPDSVIVLPELLKALVVMGEHGAPMPASLRFMAVGGGKVGAALIERARALGLPVHEGYGLSECASVVSLNRPGHTRAGSVGRPLPHVRVRIAEDGEIHVSGNAMLGYLGEPAVGGEIATGDLGAFDEDGFLYVRGRKKNQFTTSFGRNVNPEWPESLLAQTSALRQVAIFGEAMAVNIAVVVPGAAQQAAVTAAIATANAQLPRYARIGGWFVADAPFTAANGLATANGRLRRDAIWQHYRSRIHETAQALAPSLSSPTSTEL
ncbi:AMP-binding protein [Salinisphaera sp. T5B8]|uniref:AMP-binding protein n=1 Tax=Salinisphaera sp. T5B8 TaxID=1304154 RepID=UPI00333F4584